MSESKSEKQPIYKKKWFWIVAIIAVFIIGGAISGAEKDPKKVGEGSGSSETTSESSTFKVGDTIAIDEQEIVITSVDRNYTTGNEYFKAADGKEYIKLNLQIKNVSKEQKDYNALYWTVEDSNGDIMSYAAMAQADNALNSGQLAAGGTKKASLVFEVPKGDTKLKAHFKPGFISSREAIIEL